MGKIRKLKQSEMGTFADILMDAFPGMDLKGEEGRKKLVAWMKALHSKESNSTVLGHFNNGRMDGGMRYLDFDMTFLDVPVKAGGVGIVGVSLTDKKKHVAKDMITEFIRYYEKRKAYVTLLYPFRPDFYRRMGYGMSTPVYHYRVETGALPDRGNRDNVRFLTLKDADKVYKFQKEYCEKHNGMITMRKYEVNRFLKSQMKALGVFRNKRLEAIAFFKFSKASKDTFIKNDIDMLLMETSGPAALLDLFSFLYVQKDQIDAVKFIMQDNSLAYVLGDPRGAEHEIVEPVNHLCGKWGLGIMIRITEPEKFLQQLKEHNFNNENLSIRFIIHDDFLDREHDFTLTVKNGKIAKKSKPDCVVIMDTPEFSSMLSGAVTFRDLYNMGGAEISDEKFADNVSRVFYFHQKPVCETQF